MRQLLEGDGMPFEEEALQVFLHLCWAQGLNIYKVLRLDAVFKSRHADHYFVIFILLGQYIRFNFVKQRLDLVIKVAGLIVSCAQVVGAVDSIGVVMLDRGEALN